MRRLPKLLLRGGRVIDPASKQDRIADVLLDGDKIVKVEAHIDETKAKTMECEGLVVTPGFIDMHVHLREPGFEDEETIITGTEAAAAGGITTIAAMPNTNPVADSRAVIDFIAHSARANAKVDIVPIGAITVGQQGEQLAELADMHEGGATAFSDDGRCLMNAGLMRRALEYSKMLNAVIIVHAEDTNLAGRGQMNEGYFSTVLGLAGIPTAAEVVIVARDIELARMTGARIHFAHVSCRESIELIGRAKAEGLAVTCEVTPHHLLLTEDSLIEYDTRYKMNPPLRTHEDCQALIEALRDGIIDVVASDHAPHATHEKEREFCLAPFGIIGLESTVSLMLSELVAGNKLELSRFVESMTVKPAQILGMTGYARLEAGAMANITILDLNKKHNLYMDSMGREKFFSKSKNSPFVGREVTGIAAAAIVGGKVVYQQDSIKVGS